MKRVPRAALWVALATCQCAMRDPAPRAPDGSATSGRAPADFDVAAACVDWTDATGDVDAQRHTSFPELEDAGCFVPVKYAGGRVTGIGPTPDGCGFPGDATRAVLEARAEVYEAIARGDATRTPLELACALAPDVREAAALHNAATLRSYAATLRDTSPAFPYATVSTFGYGAGAQDASPLVGWRPDAACRALDDADRDGLGVNVLRAARVADAWRAGVAPLVTVSGGAVHAKLVEAFMLEHLIHCDGGVPRERILLDPCADHTHTNVRNTGAMVASLGARTAYIVTDDFLQGDYLQDWTAFDLIGGSIDQRALRDFGFLLGSWRQASDGMPSGFWYTPYRFWGDARLGEFTCQGDVGRRE